MSYAQFNPVNGMTISDARSSGRLRELERVFSAQSSVIPRGDTIVVDVSGANGKTYEPARQAMRWSSEAELRPVVKAIIKWSSKGQLLRAAQRAYSGIKAFLLYR